MAIDLIILGAVLLFALVGALTGAARQLAQWLALGLAWYASRKLGPFLGPKLAQSMQWPQLVGLICANIILFTVVLVTMRQALTLLLRKVMGAGDGERRMVDRGLGFLLGGGKVAILAWVVLSALTFAEQHVTVAGRRLGVAAKDSVAFDVTRRFNLFELTQFSALGSLSEVMKRAGQPEYARQLAKDPAYKSMLQDPRFKRVLADPKVRAAIEKGDTQALLRNDQVLQLIQDATFSSRMEAALKAAEEK